jgi:F-type H+-transporting ATPase subunit a
MWFLMEAPTSASGIVHGAAQAARQAGENGAESPGIVTGSWLHWLYTGHLIREDVIPEEVLLGVVVMFLMGLACYLLTRRLDLRRPSKAQAALELVVSGLQNMVVGLIGPDGMRYLPFIGTLFLYILLMNLVGVIPLWKTPTANLNVTVAMALTTIIYVHYHGIRANGIGGYLRHYVGEPWQMFPLNIPLHLIGELARPISLSLRLFGNMFGEDTVIAILIMLAAPTWIIAAQFPMILLTIFTAFVQAMVFTMLSCTYIAGFVAHNEHHPPGHEHDIVDEEHGLLLDSPLPAPPV